MKMRFRSVLWYLSVPVALAAMVAVFQRQLLLKIPKIGFIFYFLAGGSIPPYFDTNIFSHQDKWLKSNDVVISIPGKSGTHWMMYTAHVLRSKGKVEPMKDIYLELPWAEFVYYPQQTLEQRSELIRQRGKGKPFNIVKTHCGPPVLKLRDDVKYIVSARNILDALASLRPFLTATSKDFANLWGGFPAHAGGGFTDEEWEKFALVDAGNGMSVLEVVFISFYKGWLPYLNQTNVLLIHYSDRIKDDATQVRRIAKFLDLHLTDDELNNIVNLVSFQSMSKIADAFEHLHILDIGKDLGYLPRDLKMFETANNEKALLNKGAKRDASKEFDARFIQKAEEIINRSFDPEVVEWLQNGGVPKFLNKVG